MKEKKKNPGWGPSAHRGAAFDLPGWHVKPCCPAQILSTIYKGLPISPPSTPTLPPGFPNARNKDLLEALTGAAASLSDCLGPRSRRGPEQGKSESPASPPADVYETTAQEPTFPSQPQTVIHVLPAGQSQLPTEHHMICSDIRSARDSPSASPFHACGLHHSPCPGSHRSRWYRVGNCCFLTKYFLVAWFLLFLPEGEKAASTAFGFVRSLCVAEARQ